MSYANKKYNDGTSMGQRFAVSPGPEKPRKPPKLLIKGSITALGEGEFSTDLVYSFKISPLGQDRNGNDRVFTFINYCKAEDRNSETGSEARRRIAHSLRKRHALLWSNFHEAYD